MKIVIEDNDFQKEWFWFKDRRRYCFSCYWFSVNIYYKK